MLPESNVNNRIWNIHKRTWGFNEILEGGEMATVGLVN